MTPERWQQIKQVYESALEREETRRAAFVEEACAGDPELRREVESLLAYPDPDQRFMGVPALELVARALDGEWPASLVERQLGPYKILSLLGEGGMGKVYRAVDTRLGRAVAIKISTEEFNKRFEREARTISALNHPHICTLYDIGSLPSGSGYMVTELVEGETLRDWLKHSSAVEHGVEIARQILEALRAAHGVGIIHRDRRDGDGRLKCSRADHGNCRLYVTGANPRAGSRSAE
jgi:hypothetical protein